MFMKIFGFFIIFFAALSTGFEFGPHQNEGFSNFLQLAIDKYPAWLVENGLDPAPPVERTADLSTSNTLLNLDCEISDYFVEGFSRNSGGMVTEADLLNARLDFFLEYQGTTTFGGHYKANGTVMFNVPLEGEGQWTIRTQFMSSRVFMEGFQITSDGFIDLNASDIRYADIYAGDASYFNFEGLLEGDAEQYEDVVKDSVMGRFRQFISFNPFNDENNDGYPAVGLLYNYLLEVFANTPVSEIIGTTMPPSSTQTDQPTTDSTPPPCQSLRHGNEYGTEKVELNEDTIMILEKALGRQAGESRKWILLLTGSENM